MYSVLIVCSVNAISDSMPESNINKTAIGTAGLVLGVVVFCAGLICYIRNTRRGERLNRIIIKNGSAQVLENSFYFVS